MVEARALLTSLTAVILAVGCTKNTSDTETSSEATAEVATASTSETADIATASASETTGSPVTSSTTTANDTSSNPTSDTSADPAAGTSTSESDPSTGTPAMPCHLAYDKASCEAGVGCVFIPGREMFVREGECAPTDLGEVGFCYSMEGGGPDTPSIYYQVETGRVFRFPNSPEPPDGWVECTCAAPSPEACQACWDECSEETSSTG